MHNEVLARSTTIKKNSDECNTKLKSFIAAFHPHRCLHSDSIRTNDAFRARPPSTHIPRCADCYAICLLSYSNILHSQCYHINFSLPSNGGRTFFALFACVFLSRSAALASRFISNDCFWIFSQRYFYFRARCIGANVNWRFIAHFYLYTATVAAQFQLIHSFFYLG